MPFLTTSCGFFFRKETCFLCDVVSIFVLDRSNLQTCEGKREEEGGGGGGRSLGFPL